MQRRNDLRIFSAAVMLAVFSLFSCSDKGEEAENRAPSISSASSATAIAGQAFSYTARATDPDGTTPSIHFENIPSWLDTNGVVISGMPTVDTPDTSFTVIAEDDFLADTLHVSVNVLDEEPQVSYSDQVQPIFNNNCAGSSCHIGGSASGLRLGNYSQLMQGGNSGPVVVSGDPDGSIIVGRLEGTITPQMPFGEQPLSPAQIQTIRDWIEQGAQNN